jgi:hypothetical protein
MQTSNTYYKKHSNTFVTDFTANMAPAYISNPEHDNHIPHRRH